VGDLLRVNRRLVALIAPVALTLAACGGGDDGGGGSEEAAAPADSAEVRVVDTDYEPEKVAVFTGGTVTWTWDANLVHDVKSGEFKSELQKEGTFEHTFEEPGTYEYTCSVHPQMKGEVEVVDE
jgi:plastocyanin